jgi:hypothetical protein
MKRFRLKDLTEKEKLHIVWTIENSDELNYCKTFYYAARAIEVYGSGCRDNTFKQLVAIGKKLETYDVYNGRIH